MMGDILQNALIEHYVNAKGLITAQDLDAAQFNKWQSLIDTLLEQALALNSQVWTNQTEMETNANTTIIWDALHEIYDQMIGQVNGRPLQKNDSIKLLIVAYAKKSNNADEVTISSKESFRLKIEYYLAREIIVQRGKSIRIIEDELNDRKCIRRLITSRKRHIKRQSLDEKGINKRPEKKCQLWNQDSVLYIYKGQTSCHTRKHEMVSATAILTGRNNSEVKLTVEYCPHCKKFLMSYTVYESYREKYGMLLGKLRMDSASTSGIADIVLSDCSPLKLNGYSVNQQDGYSQQDRQYILSKVIEKGALLKSEVVRYLEYFINMNGRRIGNEIALSKWKQDLEFVLQYKIREQDEYEIRRIKKY